MSLRTTHVAKTLEKADEKAIVLAMAHGDLGGQLRLRAVAGLHLAPSCPSETSLTRLDHYLNELEFACLSVTMAVNLLHAAEAEPIELPRKLPIPSR